MPRLRQLLPTLLFALSALAGARANAAPAAKPAPGPDAFDQRQLAALEWRSIGPYRGGRVTAVTGVRGPAQPLLLRRHRRRRLEDRRTAASLEPTCPTARSGPARWARSPCAAPTPTWSTSGMGEACIRGNLSHGDGVYRSTDAGQTWTHVGLADTRQIGRIRVHPRDPDLVYVAALGHAFGPNHERGVFRSRDGGATWKASCSWTTAPARSTSPWIRPIRASSTPRCGRCTARRGAWRAAAPAAALCKSTDGGDTWNAARRAKGLPDGLCGRIGVSRLAGRLEPRVRDHRGRRRAGVFRSDDGGKTWRRTSEDRNLRQRAWYYTHIFADPKNAETVYVLNVEFLRSQDGGKTFQRDPHAARRQPRPVDRSGRSEADDRGQRRRRQRLHRRRQLVDAAGQPADRAVLPRDRRRRVSPTASTARSRTTRRWRIASRTGGAGIGRTDWYDVGGGESGYDRAQAGRPEHRVRGLLRRLPDAPRPAHRAGARRHRLPRQPDGLGRRGRAATASSGPSPS